MKNIIKFICLLLIILCNCLSEPFTWNENILENSSPPTIDLPNKNIVINEFYCTENHCFLELYSPKYNSLNNCNLQIFNINEIININLNNNEFGIKNYFVILSGGAPIPDQIHSIINPEIIILNNNIADIKLICNEQIIDQICFGESIFCSDYIEFTEWGFNSLSRIPNGFDNDNIMNFQYVNTTAGSSNDEI